MEAEATRGAICCRCRGHAGGDGGVPYKARVYARRKYCAIAPSFATLLLTSVLVCSLEGRVRSQVGMRRAKLQACGAHRYVQRTFYTCPM